jgi:hypothetical protein
VFPPVRTYSDYREWLSRATLVVSGAVSLSSEVRAPLTHVRRVTYLAARTVLRVQVLLVLACTPLASLAVITANHGESLPATDPSAPPATLADMVGVEARNAVASAVAGALAVASLLRAFSGPEGLLWLLQMARETTALCGCRTPWERLRFEAHVCGFRCRRAAVQALLLFGPVLFLFWIIYVGVVRAGRGDAAREAEMTFAADAPLSICAGLVLVVFFGALSGCSHGLPVDAVPLVRANAPGIAIAMATPRRSELFQHLPCPLCEASPHRSRSYGRWDAVLDVLAGWLGLVPRGESHFELHPHPAHESIVFVPGVRAAPNMVNVLQSSLAWFRRRQQRLHDGDSDALDDLDEANEDPWGGGEEDDDNLAKGQAEDGPGGAAPARSCCRPPCSTSPSSPAKVGVVASSPR